MVFNEMTNNEIMLEIKTIEQEHLAVKARILVEVTKMEELEKAYRDAQEVIIKRLKSNE